MSARGIEHSKIVDMDQPAALSRLKEILAANKWGVLSDIDMKAILKEKLGVEVEPYNTLDVCNPKFANRGLGISKQAGLVLPCKMAVYMQAGKTHVALYLPTKQLPKEVEKYEQLSEISREAEASLRAIIDSI